jgi:mannose/fructose/N-acetylgalactosamine-specific phosphotransferase system component IIC
MIFIGGVSVLVAGAMLSNKGMIIGATIGLFASALVAIGATFAIRTQKRVVFSDNISISNPLMSSNV